MSLTIDISALQTLPPSLINRDDTGAPKSAIFGGVPRQRVSSQAWKRAIRKYVAENLDPESIGVRTRLVVDVILKEIANIKGEETDTDDVKAVEALFKSAKIVLKDAPAKKDDEASEEAPTKNKTSTYLLFLSPRQIHNAAQAIVDSRESGEKIPAKKAKELLNQEHSADIAMFGRMVADDSTYNVDASVQVAHAIGVHESSPEFDYFTAVDDYVESSDETGAGMIGTVQMMSSTLYRYATIDMDSLAENLGSKDVAKTCALHFIDAFIKSMPTGKINTFANQTLPELVYIALRDTRPVSLVNAFEEPVATTATTGRREAAAEAMAKEEKELEEQYGFTPRAAFVLGLGELRDAFADITKETTLPELDAVLEAALNEAN